MSFKKNLSLILGTLIIAVAFYFSANPPRLPSTKTPAPATQTPNSAIEQKINFGGALPEQILPTQVNSGETALDLLLQAKSDKVELKDYSFGKAVEAIDGVKNGTEGKYWLYYVNGEQAQVGAGEYQLQPNDKIEWRFEKEE